MKVGHIGALRSQYIGEQNMNNDKDELNQLITKIADF
jgi:hypothetical protein